MTESDIEAVILETYHKIKGLSLAASKINELKKLWEKAALSNSGGYSEADLRVAFLAARAVKLQERAWVFNTSEEYIQSLKDKQPSDK